MKPLPLFFIVLFVCFLIAVIVPQVLHFRAEMLPVSVTSLGASTVLANPAGTIAAPAHAGDVYSSDAGMSGVTGFAASLINGQAGEAVGVYVPGLFALPIRQQPDGHPEYVDRDDNILTEFSLPRKYGVTGLLAHNYLSGSRFFQLKSGQDVVLVYGDGRLEHYRVNRIEAFQALKPNSPFSEFVDLSDPHHSLLSSANLFNRVYTTSQQLVFQTCIEAGDEPSWGRIFIIASLAEPLKLGVPESGLSTSLN